jgi:drug/metabolite transporter (DMT)-like permease
MPVDWAGAAVLSAAFSGMVNIIDSHLITRRLPGLRAYMLLVAIAVLVLSLVLLYLFPIPEDAGTWPVIVAIIVSILRMTSVTIMIYTLKKEEVTRVIPVVNTYPIFVAIMAVPLLGETLNYWQWTAIIIVVAGVLMISIRRSPGSSVTWLGKTFFLLFGSSLFMAMADVTAKYTLVYISPWNMYSITLICMSGVFLLISLRPQVLRELNKSKKRNSAIIIVIFNEILAVIGVVLLYWAMQRGPVSLVSTIFGSKPIFVFMYTLVISRVLPMLLEWQYDKVMLPAKLVAIILIVGGIAIIYLT